MLIRVTNGADSIFEVSLLIPLSHDATLAAENDAVPITPKLLGWNLEMESVCKNITGNQI